MVSCLGSVLQHDFHLHSVRDAQLPLIKWFTAHSGLQHVACRFWKGLLAVWVGGAIGQGGAFLLARYLVRDWVVTYIARKWSKVRHLYPKLQDLI